VVIPAEALANRTVGVLVDDESFCFPEPFGGFGYQGDFVKCDSLFGIGDVNEGTFVPVVIFWPKKKKVVGCFRDWNEKTHYIPLSSVKIISVPKRKSCLPFIIVPCSCRWCRCV
jgi:hypothetical protein